MTQSTASQPATTIITQQSEASLWPLPATIQNYTPTELPVDILQVQAKYLAPQTEYLLKGFVRSSNLQSGFMYHNFYIYAPYVRQEPFKPFYIKHGIDIANGITLVWGDMDEPFRDSEFGTATNLGELRSKIKALLEHENMLHLIGNLYALSKKAKIDEATAVALDENTDA